MKQMAKEPGDLVRLEEWEMRNPDRIDVIIEALRETWSRVPDWRLGQLIVNLTRSLGHQDPFFIEDEEMLKAIQSIFTQHQEVV